jgi:hypothetical protein
MTSRQPSVFCVLPHKAETTVEAILHAIRQPQLSSPFNDAATAFVADLSRTLLSDRSIRLFPELMALAHWFRAAKLWQLAESLRHSTAPGVPLAKGLVFHIAPANVDSVFVYSWLLSLLCGNANIVRISRRATNQIDAFLAVAEHLLREDRYAQTAATNVVLTYEHDAGISSALSAACQLRVVWGGDATVSQIRAIPLPPLSSELAFPNRFSLAVIGSAAVNALSEPKLADLARRFYNDAFWFYQQACSSPRAIVWIGSPAENAAAKTRFWKAIDITVEHMKPENAAGNVMNRLTTTYRIAESRRHAAVVSAPVTMPARIKADTLAVEDRLCHEGNSVFIEIERQDIQKLPELLAPVDQTIATFGIGRDQWLPLLPALPPHAADRIVPIGSALEFNELWDGQNFLRSFTRTVTIA